MYQKTMVKLEKIKTLKKIRSRNGQDSGFVEISISLNVREEMICKIVEVVEKVIGPYEILFWSSLV